MNQKKFIKRELSKFLSLSMDGIFDLFITVNVVLWDQINNTFSIFYGQDYTNDHFKYAIYGPIEIDNILQLSKIPFNDDETDITNLLDSVHQEKSGLSIFELVNKVYVFRYFK